MLCAPCLSAADYEGTLEKLSRARNGDAAAREEVIRDNLPLVRYVLKRFQDRSAEYEDLYQYGCMGLVKAVDRFDPSYEARFSTYAVPVIMGEIRRYLRDSGPIHVSRTIRENAVKIERFRQKYIEEQGCEPNLSQISKALALSEESAVLAANACRRVRSLNEPIDSYGDLRLMDVIGADGMEDADKCILLSKLLQDLSPEERRLIIRRYFHSNTQSEIAKDMGISQVQVSRLESRILKRMRKDAEA